MTESKSYPKNHHYVPRFLLKNFTYGKKSRVYVFDKKDQKQFETNVRNIASQTGFYNINFKGISISFEESFSKLESICSKIIKKIVKEVSLSSLSEDEKRHLSIFIVTQHLRTPNARTRIYEYSKLLEEKFIEMGFDPNNIDNFKPIDKKEANIISLNLLTDLELYLPHLVNKDWILLKGNKSNPFYISDNPIAMQNISDSMRGSIGFGVDGIEIYLPLSSTLTLALYCPSIINWMKQAYESTKGSIEIGRMFVENLERFEEFIEALEVGSPVQIDEENIINLNSLQVYYAERQIYSSNNNFNLAYDMINDNSEIITGPRPEVR